MKIYLVAIKNTYHRIVRICLLVFSAPFLVIKMAITDAKEEASDIERASKG